MALAVVLGMTLFGSAGLADATVAAPAYRLATSSAAASAAASNKPQAADLGNSFTVTAMVLPSKPVPACNPDSFGVPAAMELAFAPAGLTVDTLPAHRYRVYGDTASELVQQIARCAPGGDFAGQTAYYLNYSFYPKAVADGQCRLTDVKVGVRVQTSLPSWQPGANAAPGLAATWQRFINNLSVHERGHTDRDILAGAKLLKALRGLSAGNCNQLTTTAINTARATLLDLQAANQSYDADTNHGATQGAIIP